MVGWRSNRSVDGKSLDLALVDHASHGRRAMGTHACTAIDYAFSGGQFTLNDRHGV